MFFHDINLYYRKEIIFLDLIQHKNQRYAVFTTFLCAHFVCNPFCKYKATLYCKILSYILQKVTELYTYVFNTNTISRLELNFRLSTIITLILK